MAFKCKINKNNFASKFHNGVKAVAQFSSPAKDIDSEGNDRPLTADQQAAKDAKNKVSLAPPPSTKPKKRTYSEAYKKRDMKTYGKLTEAEYTAEAKRQNKSKKETGKWDAPKKAMESKAEVTKKEVVKPEAKKEVVKPSAKQVKKAKVEKAKTELKTVKTDNKKEVKELKKSNKAEKIDAKVKVAEAKGKTRRAERLKARAERKRTGKTKKEQGRNIFGGKTRKQKKKEAAAAEEIKMGLAKAPARYKKNK